MEVGETLLVYTAQEWRDWLMQHHRDKTEIWLIYFKKASGKKGVTYEQSVEEAICFGWIDGAIKTLDKDTYAGRFTPRRKKSHWTEANRLLALRLIGEGRMTEAGRAILPENVLSH